MLDPIGRANNNTHCLYPTAISSIRHQQSTDTISSNNRSCCSRCIGVFESILKAIFYIPIRILSIPITAISQILFEKTQEESPKKAPGKVDKQSSKTRPAFKLYFSKDYPITIGKGNAITSFETIDEQNLASLLGSKKNEFPLELVNINYLKKEFKTRFPEFTPKTFKALEYTGAIVYEHDEDSENCHSFCFVHLEEVATSSPSIFLHDSEIYQGIEGKNLGNIRNRINLCLEAAFQNDHPILVIKLVNSSFAFMRALFKKEIEAHYPGCFKQVYFIQFNPIQETAKARKITTLADIKKED